MELTQLTMYFENGAQTSMQAVLPGKLGGGSLLPAPMLIEAHTNAHGQIDGKWLSNSSGESESLLQQSQLRQGPAEYHPLSTTELSTAEGAAAFFPSVAEELQQQPG